MIRSPQKLTFARARSRLAFWILTAACCFGVIVWFLIANRSRVEVVLPFGFGTRTGPVSIVIFVSMAIGAFWVVALQALLSARRHLKDAYRRWSRPRTDTPHRCEAPHIVSRPNHTMALGYHFDSEKSGQAS